MTLQPTATAARTRPHGNSRILSHFRRPALCFRVVVWLAPQWAFAAAAAPIPTTIEDFHLPGTQIGDVSIGAIGPSADCALCHGNFDPVAEPYRPWAGSLMGQAGRDPLFYAQMTTANQDVANAGYYCMRCHVPVSFVTGNAYDVSGDSLNARDRDGVSCHFCHAMVDPIYKPGISPPEDAAVLAGLAEVPAHYGDSMFVLDPTGLRRGPYSDPASPHDAIRAPFLRTGDYCGTCHDVGNPCVTLQPDGTFRYNTLDEPSPTFDPHGQFPLERTYTEWKLSAFANGGVNMGGRFGGTGPQVVSTCQDCHMPTTVGRGCYFAAERADLKRHEFAGASAWVLQIIRDYYAGDPEVDPAGVESGRLNAVAMVQRAASLAAEQDCGALRVRVTNETGHKLPTGHIEGRRVWVNVKVRDDQGALLVEYGHYDGATAELDEATTTVYEMHVGLSAEAAALTGYSEGVTTHMALADTIEKDTRIPPRGFQNQTYADAGAPAVGIAFADGQYWHDSLFPLPVGGASAEVTVYYQTVTRHYIEALHSANVTNHWGQTLYDLWLGSDKGAPIPIVTGTFTLDPLAGADADGDGVSNCEDACPGVDDRLFAADCHTAIPTVSGWGAVILALVLATLGKLRLGDTGSVSH
ncbi:MAG: hypothetical protein HY763_15010 [Planctomycetes bacterium]|nr:hypothetical protein [Planctomycetota bacterium]